MHTLEIATHSPELVLAIMVKAKDRTVTADECQRLPLI